MSRFLIAFLLFSAWHVSANDLPDMGTSANTVLTAAKEKEIGESYLQYLRQKNRTLDDVEVDNYLNRLGYQLVSNTQSSDYPFTFFTLRDQSINAFAVPGGYIGMNAGLILKTRNESELAAVLAHEIAHVTQRHINRSIEKMDGLSIPMMAAMLATMAVASKNPAAGQAALATMIAGSVQMQLDFTRAHEKEADRVGMDILAKAGFDPHSMHGFFQKLQDNSSYAGTAPEFLRSHPLTTNRIAESKTLASRYPKAMVKDSAQYQLIRAKVLVATSTNLSQLIKQLTNSLKSGKFRDERAVRYALLLATLKSGKTDHVKIHLDWLQQNDGDRVVYHLADARSKLLEKDIQGAKKIYQTALAIYPNDYMLSLAYTDLLIGQAQMQTALDILQPLKNNLPTHQKPDYYRILAQAQRGLGQTGEAHFSMAEHYRVKGQTKASIEQLEQGLRVQPLDFYLKSKLEAQLQIQQDLLAEEQENEKKLGN